MTRTVDIVDAKTLRAWVRGKRLANPKVRGNATWDLLAALLYSYDSLSSSEADKVRAIVARRLRRRGYKKPRTDQRMVGIVLGSAIDRELMATVMAEKAGFTSKEAAPSLAYMLGPLLSGELGQYNGGHRSKSPP